MQSKRRQQPSQGGHSERASKDGNGRLMLGTARCALAHPDDVDYFSLIGAAIFSAGAGGNAGWAPAFCASASGRAGSGGGVAAGCRSSSRGHRRPGFRARRRLQRLGRLRQLLRTTRAQISASDRPTSRGRRDQRGRNEKIIPVAALVLVGRHVVHRKFVRDDQRPAGAMFPRPSSVRNRARIRLILGADFPGGVAHAALRCRSTATA